MMNRENSLKSFYKKSILKKFIIYTRIFIQKVKKKNLNQYNLSQLKLLKRILKKILNFNHLVYKLFGINKLQYVL